MVVEDQCAGPLNRKLIGRGLKLYKVVSSVFITFLKLLSRLKSVGRSRCEKS